MGYYSGNLIIHHDTSDYIKPKEQGEVLTLRFYASFNKSKLYLNTTILNQLLNSGTVQNFIIKESTTYINKHSDEINQSINKLFSKEYIPTVTVKIIGKYFYIKVYCGRNHTIENCITAISKQVKREKTIIDILKG